MSSHHIVRDKQEPALLVLGLDRFDGELLGQLLEWSPVLIATPDTAEQLDSRGIKIDLLTGDTTGAVVQSDIKLIPATGGFINAAIRYLIENDFPSVNIVTDEFNLQDYEPFIHQINMVIFINDQKIYSIGAGFCKWKPAGEKITLLSAAQGLRLHGLIKIDAGQYQTTNDGLFSLYFDDPFMFIAEEL